MDDLELSPWGAAGAAGAGGAGAGLRAIPLSELQAAIEAAAPPEPPPDPDPDPFDEDRLAASTPLPAGTSPANDPPPGGTQ